MYSPWSNSHTSGNISGKCVFICYHGLSTKFKLCPFYDLVTRDITINRTSVCPGRICLLTLQGWHEFSLSYNKFGTVPFMGYFSATSLIPQLLKCTTFLAWMGHPTKKCAYLLISFNSAIHNFRIVHKLLRLLISTHIDTSLFSLTSYGIFSLDVLDMLVKYQDTTVGARKQWTEWKCPMYLWE